ncbi:hypothetical protein PR048_017215 [Dryococelus australis]|uniref:Uncharacterized protein n=1 Tax=Dryococelus australis TaxID=614101 RepID=A0ABQ9H8Y5_9NEOP|nr:hypothetical protein PR048_017215 [Dryococelus australis]
MVAIQMSMEQPRNERSEGTGDPRENPPTSGNVWHDSQLESKFSLIASLFALMMAVMRRGWDSTRCQKLFRAILIHDRLPQCTGIGRSRIHAPHIPHDSIPDDFDRTEVGASEKAEVTMNGLLCSSSHSVAIREWWGPVHCLAVGRDLLQGAVGAEMGARDLPAGSYVVRRRGTKHVYQEAHFIPLGEGPTALLLVYLLLPTEPADDDICHDMLCATGQLSLATIFISEGRYIYKAREVCRAYRLVDSEVLRNEECLRQAGTGKDSPMARKITSAFLQYPAERNVSGKFYIPARYVYLAVRMGDMFASSFLDGLMPLAITSMVRTTTTTADSSTTVANTTSASSDVCPGAPEATNSSSSSNKGGEFDWSELVQSYITNGNTYGALLFIMLAARLVQMWSPKMMVVGAAVLTIVIAFLTPALAHWNVNALIVARVVQGFSIVSLRLTSSESALSVHRESIYLPHLLSTPLGFLQTSVNNCVEFSSDVSSSSVGAAVSEPLEFSPPTKTNRAQSPVHSRIFSSGNRAERCRWSAGFLGVLPYPPPCILALLHSHLIPPRWFSGPRASNIASIVSSSVTGYLIDNSGWESVFYICGGMKILSVILWFFAVYDSPLKHPRISEEESLYITSTINKETKASLEIQLVIKISLLLLKIDPTGHLNMKKKSEVTMEYSEGNAVIGVTQCNSGTSSGGHEYTTLHSCPRRLAKLPVPWLRIFLSAPVWAYLSVSISNIWMTFILNNELPTYLKNMLYYSTSNVSTK